MIVTASSDFNAFKVNKALNRVWRGTSPLALQRQSSRDLSSSEVITMDMEETLKRIRLDNLLRLTDIKFAGFAFALSVGNLNSMPQSKRAKVGTLLLYLMS